ALDVLRLERRGRLREVGSHAVWSVSSGRRGCGAHQLRDDNLDTFWQSDGELPHRVDLQFGRRTNVSAILIHVDYVLDETYTPSVVSVSAGNDPHDMRTLGVLSLSRPSGWVLLEVRRPLRAFCLQVAVRVNEGSGRDTRVRQMKVYSPAEETVVSALSKPAAFSTQECQMFSRIR
ncbi:unnamed protein product, partial [Ixodes hexagonus]